jgi:hypothetical protein
MEFGNAPDNKNGVIVYLPNKKDENAAGVVLLLALCCPL